MTEKITPQIIRKLLDYDPDTGVLTWRIRPGNARFNNRFAGKPALTATNTHGHLCGRIMGQRVYAHRAAFAHFHGKWPEHNVDHDNGKEWDNRIENLIDRPQHDNTKNMKRSKANKSGVTGVSWDQQTGKWRATINEDGGRKNLGRFGSFDEAVQARRDEEKRLGYNTNHGRAST